MVKIACFILLSCGSACAVASFETPIQPEPHGAAVRANMAAHIINPIPPVAGETVVDANRPVLATEKYRTGQVEKPGKEEPRSLTGAAD